jgi:ABC-type transport system substrate-binding protein
LPTEKGPGARASRWAALLCLFAALMPHAAAAQVSERLRVLRYAIPVAESGFDPAQISDASSRMITANIFEAPLTYDYLARPARLVPQTAAALPAISDDFTRFTFRIRPGIHFADDPAFGGVPRELVAADYVYAFKRHYDPANKSASLFQFENARVLGLSELRRRAMEGRKPFDYDTEVDGIRTLDRYTFEVRLAAPSPRFHYVFADGSVLGAVAREVVQAYPGRTMEHPVGTGPFRLTQWQRSARMVLERNPRYRQHTYDAQPAPEDTEGQALLTRLRGRRLPMVDRVEISVIEEAQPRWLAFLNGQMDMSERLPEEFVGVAIPGGKLAPNLRRQGVQMDRMVAVDAHFTYFAMENPVVGGYTPEKVALRRAISLAYDGARELALVRRGQAVAAQGMFPPLLPGYDPKFRSEMSEYSPARARALLDLYGYIDRDGDGRREMPDGSPLVLRYTTEPDQRSRQLQELWQRTMDAVGLRIEFKVAPWPENLKASRAGKVMMWGVSWSATHPASSFFDMMYGPNKGQANHARFDLPAFNEIYARQLVLPDGPQRLALLHQGQLLGVAYMPYKITAHSVLTALMHRHVIGYRRHPFMRDFWRYVDIESGQP